MPTNLDAIYENGALRPVGEIALPPVAGMLVRLTVSHSSQAETSFHWSVQPNSPQSLEKMLATASNSPAKNGNDVSRPAFWRSLGDLGCCCCPQVAV